MRTAISSSPTARSAAGRGTSPLPAMRATSSSSPMRRAPPRWRWSRPTAWRSARAPALPASRATPCRSTAPPQSRSARPRRSTRWGWCRSAPRRARSRWPARSNTSSNSRCNSRSIACNSAGRSRSSKRCSTTLRASPARSPLPARRPMPPPRRSPAMGSAARWSRPKSRSPSCGSARRPGPARESPIRCMVRWALPTSIRCTMRRAAFGRGARSSATRPIGLPSSAIWSPRAAPTRCGRSSPKDREATMALNFHFDPVDLPPECKELRQEVRAFLQEEIAAGSFSPHSGRSGSEKAFARKVGARGWIGMTWPKQYGGHERSHLERYVVIEEMLAHRAPTRSYSTADRQSGPVILRYGQEAVKEKILTSNAHNSDYMIALLRTSPSTKENRRHGLTQFLIECKTPGITIRPIINLTGSHDFNEVVFDDAFVPDLHLIGEVDMAWKQATDELAYERGGPDRWLETFPALVELVRRAGPEPSERLAEGIGREVAHLATLRRMSVSIAGMLQAGGTPAVEAAVVKDLGTNWEQALPNKVRLLAPPTGDSAPEINDDRFEEALRHTTLIAPKLTIQGGTREVLRGIIARGLGLR